MDNKKSYIQGALSGAAVMLLVCSIVFSIVIGKVGNSSKINNKVDETSTDKYNTMSEVVKDEKVQEKLKVIAGIVDEKYYEDIDAKQVEEYLYKGLVAGVGDPYSTYYTKEEMEAVTESITGIYSGVGITMSIDSETGYILVVKVNKNSPAKDAGIKADDYIIAVDGESVVGMDTSDVANKVRGEEGTTVDITFLRDNETFVKTLTRKSIEEETVEYEMLENNTGYILVSKFEVVTPDSFVEAFDSLKSQGMERLIIDLRDNLGGSVDSANKIAEYLIPKGILTYLEDKSGNRIDYTCSGDLQWDGPLAILINGASASASELVSGAVKDYGTGKLIGTKTYGKGIVQTTTTLSDGSAVKYTFAKYFTPKGENIHGKGIEPDIEVELDEINKTNGYSKETDNQLKKAIEVLSEE